ncbi:glycoside hydrolase superfamily [Mycena epipterygia]|nr:glycoside hydrolase superfamily [Mycena epipterygia]
MASRRPQKMQVIFLGALLLSTLIPSGLAAPARGLVPRGAAAHSSASAFAPSNSASAGNGSAVPLNSSVPTAPANSSTSTGNSSASAGKSWAGANNYYAHNLPDADRHALLDGMKAAGMKVLRTWVSGNSAGQKGSTSTEAADVEGGGIGQYDDTVLDKIDQLMVDAHDRGIKLLIGMYDQNALLSPDIYGKTYGSSGFYTNPAAITAFNNRIKFILSTHKNKLLNNQPWSALSTHIFGLEAQNEPMVFNQTLYSNNLHWICNVSAVIREQVTDKNQLIFTGGGAGKASVQPLFFDPSCSGVDVVAVHDYSLDFSSFMPKAISDAQAAGKKLLVEEWGSLNDANRAGNLAANIKAINALGVPWLYWELITNPDPKQGQDYEIQVNGTGTDWSTIAQGAGAAAAAPGVFDFSAALAL